MFNKEFDEEESEVVQEAPTKLKVVLSNRAYLKPDPKLLKRISTHLRYEIPATYNQRENTFVFNYGPYIRGNYWVPVERTDLFQDYEVEYIDKRVYKPVIIPKPRFTLRPDQQAILDAVDDTALINGKPGFGKTITALAVAHKLQQKTLVVTTTTTIRDMWIKEVRQHLGFEPGIVGSGKFNIEPPIVIGNIQTLTRNAEKVVNEFGLIVFDECHHTPASTFTKLLLASKARYKLGLSGTLVRKDGMQCMFKDFFGFNVITPEVANTIPPTIHLYPSGVSLPGNGNTPWADRVTELTQNDMYKKEILALISLYVRLGHKVILVSDRVEFLRFIHDSTEVRSALFIGEASEAERDQMFLDMTEGRLDLFNASQSIFSEGVSQNNLSCMILGSPISDNESLLCQLAGRIMREDEGKLDPIVVDMQLVGYSAKTQANKRKLIYSQMGWVYKDIDLNYLITKVNDMQS
jgi:superfamily II DNA or RNA helicase